MHFLVIAIGSEGDINPLLEIAGALKQREHDVDFLANGHFASRVKRAGVNHIELGDEELYQKAVSNADLWDARKGFRAVWESLKDYLEPQYDILKGSVKTDEKTALVGSSLAFGARLLQETDNLKMTTVHLQPSVILSSESPPHMPGLSIPSWFPLPVRKWMMNTIDETFIDQVVKEDLNNFRRKLALNPVKNIMSKWIHSPDQVLLAFPSWYAEKRSDWPANCVFTGFPITRSENSKSLSDEVREFLKAGKPLVFTAGSAMAHSKKFFAVAAEATARLNARAILVSNFNHVIPESLPGNIMHTAYEPFDLLFKEAAVVIHHGGIGTSAQALSNGTPQLVVPFAHDQFDNAFRLKQHSVALSAKDISTSSWVVLLQELLSNQKIKDCCLKYSELINQAQPATSEAVDAIEKLNL